MFDPLNIRVAPGVKIAVVGDIHEQIDHYWKLIDKIQPSDQMIFVSAGDIYDRGAGEQAAETIVDHLMELNDKKQGYVIKGNHELKHINWAMRDKNWSQQLYWLAGQPLVLSFIFTNGTRLTVLHGGVGPKHTWNDLNIDVSTSYIRDLTPEGEVIILKRVKKDNTSLLEPSAPNGKSWHYSYDGRFGYIIAGHDVQLDGIPKFYNYSCNIDTGCYSTGILTCQVYSENGKEDTITIGK